MFRKGVMKRFITIPLPLAGQDHVTFITANAPTMMNPDEVKEKFYEDLEILIVNVPIEDKLIILGDFNARVGSEMVTTEDLYIS